MKGYIAASFAGLFIAWLIFASTAMPMVEIFDAVKFGTPMESPTLGDTAEESKSFAVLDKWYQRRIERDAADAKKAIDFTFSGKLSSPPKCGSVGLILSGLIIYAIQAALKALLFAAVIGVLWLAVKSYKWQILIGYIVAVPFVAWIVAKLTAWRAAKR